MRKHVHYSFTSTETRRLVRTDSPGRPPRLSHSSWTMGFLGADKFINTFFSFLGERVAHSFSLRSQVEHDRAWPVTTRRGHHYVLGFAHAQRFLRSQIPCRLYESPSDETINRGPPWVHAHSSGAVWESSWLSVLTSLMVSLDVKQYWTMLTHWSQLVPNMSTDIRGH